MDSYTWVSLGTTIKTNMFTDTYWNIRVNTLKYKCSNKKQLSNSLCISKTNEPTA